MNKEFKEGFLAFVVISILLVVIWFINSLTNWLFGDNVLEAAINLVFIAIVIAIIGGIAYLVVNGILSLFSKTMRVKASVIFLIAAIMFGLPNFYMQWKLRDVKREFKARANGNYSIEFTGEYSDGRAINEANYGGRLDEVVAERYRVVLGNQYLPFLQSWKTSEGWSTVIGIYVYTYIPASIYNKIVCAITCDETQGQGYDKYIEFLNTPLLGGKPEFIPAPKPNPTPTPVKVKSPKKLSNANGKK